MESKIAPTEKNKERGEGCNYGRITAFFHDGVNERNGESTECSRESAQADVRDVVFRVAVADVLELELTVEAREPACKTQQHLRERRMYIEIVFALDVVSCELAKVHFIETTGYELVLNVEWSGLADLHDFVRIVDFVETCHKGQKGQSSCYE